MEGSRTGELGEEQHTADCTALVYTKILKEALK